MDVASDAEDFVPPTPQSLKKKNPFSVTAKAKKGVPKLNKNLNKILNPNTKRKKISGASPDFKKFKEKTKQVSLFSYLKKECDKSLPSSDTLSSVKVNLFQKPDSIASKQQSVMKSSFKSTLTKKLEKIAEPSEVNSCDENICDEVKNLTLELKDDSADFDLTLNFNKHVVKPNFDRVIPVNQRTEIVMSGIELSTEVEVKNRCISSVELRNSNYSEKLIEIPNHCDSPQLKEWQLLENFNPESGDIFSTNVIFPSTESIPEIHSSSNNVVPQDQKFDCLESAENNYKCSENLSLLSGTFHDKESSVSCGKDVKDIVMPVIELSTEVETKNRCISSVKSIRNSKYFKKLIEIPNQCNSPPLRECQLLENFNPESGEIFSTSVIVPSTESEPEIQSSSNNAVPQDQEYDSLKSTENNYKCSENISLLSGTFHDENSGNGEKDIKAEKELINHNESVFIDSFNVSELKCDDSDVKPVITCDQSFSWMNDAEWKDFDFQASCSPEKSFSSEGSGQKSFLYKVKEVRRTSSNEIELFLSKLSSKSDKLKKCILKGFWTDTLTQPGDTVHVLKEFIGDEVIIDNHSGFLVVNPDFLLSSTAVVSTLFCMRKAALNHVLPQWSSGNNVMMIGSVVHDIFQQAVNLRAESFQDISSIVEQVFKKRDFLLSLCCQESPEEEIREKVMEYVPSIVSWIKRHCAFKKLTATKNLQITHVKAVEDNVWCPKYGIKGKIDMTVEAFLPNKSMKKTLPLELKTGRPTYSAEHRGQINLYTLMLEERSKEMSDGLLLYLKDATNMKLLSPDHNSRRGLIQLRNELTFYTRKWVALSCSEGDIEDCHLPKPMNSKRFCEKCQYILPCTVYQKAFTDDKLLPADHAMMSLIPSFTNHLSTSHLEYFIHWSNLMLLESTSSTIGNAFWMEEVSSREKKGMCLGWLHLDTTGKSTFEGKFFINSFSRSSASLSTSNLVSVGLRVGDYVAVSNQNNFDEIAIIMGYIFEISEEKVEVASDRDLSVTPEYRDYLFRIDKQVSSSATSVIRNNLMRLMDNETREQRLRKFIIDKSPPVFLKSLPKSVVSHGRPVLKTLNKVQQRVILKALMAEDYFIIKGMPGTGKTSTIVALVRLLVALGQSVFLTSYTHSAIDNILLKLIEYEKFVRIGQEARIHPKLKEHSFEFLTKDFTTAHQFKEFILGQKVVAATCLGINHSVFKLKSFDVCIVDEASQINQIACIGPLFHAKKFILVGDDKQLPPLVTNEKARNKGMQESLLQRLSNADNSMELVIQYRMNREIMRLCNELTYGGALQCGSEDIAQAVLNIDQSESNSSLPLWLSSAFNASLEKSVVLINTDAVSLITGEKGEGKEINNFEAELVMTILNYLLALNVLELQVGVITPYRRQVDLIESKLKFLRLKEVEVNTVDQYQGRDKDIIIISCVKSKIESDPVQKGIILNDERRLNVAVSRAKKKLIIVGSKSTLMLYIPCAKLFHCLRPDQIHNVPSDFLPT